MVFANSMEDMVRGCLSNNPIHQGCLNDNPTHQLTVGPVLIRMTVIDYAVVLWVLYHPELSDTNSRSGIT